jgi:hypothetical protein
MKWLTLKERTHNDSIIKACEEMAKLDGSPSEAFFEILLKHKLIREQTHNKNCSHLTATECNNHPN